MANSGWWQDELDNGGLLVCRTLDETFAYSTYIRCEIVGCHRSYHITQNFCYGPCPISRSITIQANLYAFIRSGCYDALTGFNIHVLGVQVPSGVQTFRTECVKKICQIIKDAKIGRLEITFEHGIMFKGKFRYLRKFRKALDKNKTIIHVNIIRGHAYQDYFDKFALRNLQRLQAIMQKVTIVILCIRKYCDTGLELLPRDVFWLVLGLAGFRRHNCDCKCSIDYSLWFDAVDRYDEKQKDKKWYELVDRTELLGEV